MDTMNQFVTMKAPAGAAAGHTSALMRSAASVSFRVREHIGGDAYVGHNLAPDSAPWSHPV